MLAKRLAYAILFAASIAAFIVTDSGVALFLCVCLSVLPFLSFFMLLFAAKRLRFDFEVREACMRGGALQITMRARLSPRFLAGSVVACVEAENTTFRKTFRKTFVFHDLSGVPYSYDYVSPDSGRITVRVPRLRLVDLLGICSVKVGCAKFAEAIVSPVLCEELQIRLSVNAHASLTGENSVPRKGGDHTEIFNIRDYVPGDSLHAVHWKLSGKFDELKSKEFGATDDNRTLVLVDASRKKGNDTATDEQLNAVFDAASSVSESLKSRGIAHYVGWFNRGAFTLEEVRDNDGFVRMVYALMSCKVDEGNAESLFYLSRAGERASFTKIVLVSPSVTIEELKQFASADVTAIVADEREGEVQEGSVKIIHVPCGNLYALTGRAL